MDLVNAAASGRMHLNDYFEELGCRYLAHAILLDSIQQVVNDPEHKLLSTQFEIAWLRDDQKALIEIERQLMRGAGKNPDPTSAAEMGRAVTAEDVFTTLNVGPQVAERLVELAINRPQFMAEHLHALKELIALPASDFVMDHHAPDVDEEAQQHRRAERVMG